MVGTAKLVRAIASLLYIGLAYIIVNSGIGEFLSIPLRIGYFPIPILFWVITFAYVLVFPPLSFPTVIATGLTTHVFLLLLNLDVTTILGELGLTLQSPHTGAVLYGPYSLYVRLVLLLFSASMTLSFTSRTRGAGLPANRFLRERIFEDPLLMVLPLLAAVLLFEYASIPHYGMLASSGFAFALGSLVGAMMPNIAARLLGWQQACLAKREHWILVGLFLLASLLRISTLFRLISVSGYDFLSSDSWSHFDAAEGHFRGIGTPSNYAAGYSLFLAGIMLLFPSYFPDDFSRTGYTPSLYLLGIAQSLLAGLAAVALYVFCKRAFNRQVGVIASTYFSLGQTFIMTSLWFKYPALEIVYLPFILCLASFIPKGKGGWRLTSAAGLGLLSGLLIATREVNLPIIVIMLIFWFLLLGFEILPRSIAFKACGITFLFLAVALAPFIYRNYQNYGHFYFPKKEHVSHRYKSALVYEYETVKVVTMIGKTKDVWIEWISSLPDRIGELLTGFLSSYGWTRFDLIFLFRNSLYYYHMVFYTTCLVFLGLAYLSVRMKSNIGAPLVLAYILLKMGSQTVALGREEHTPPLLVVLAIPAGIGISLMANYLRGRSLQIGTPKGSDWRRKRQSEWNIGS